MISYLIICISSLFTAALTLYSGFGLGTLLMPVFALFFPLEIAIAATAVVHVANNIFKIAAVGRFADKSIVLRFGIPAIVATLFGALVLGYVSDQGAITTYHIGSRAAVVTPLKLVISLLMLIFALFELIPFLKKLTFDRKYLPLGGILSGFFGGISGHQGALRAAFLTKVGISIESFVGTSAVVAFMVDCIRITTYVIMIFLAKKTSLLGTEEWPLILAGIAGAYAGVTLGKKYLHKVTMETVQTLTGILLFGIALAIGSGII